MKKYLVLAACSVAALGFVAGCNKADDTTTTPPPTTTTPMRPATTDATAPDAAAPGTKMGGATKPGGVVAPPGPKGAGAGAAPKAM